LIRLDDDAAGDLAIAPARGVRHAARGHLIDREPTTADDDDPRVLLEIDRRSRAAARVKLELEAAVDELGRRARHPAGAAEHEVHVLSWQHDHRRDDAATTRARSELVAAWWQLEHAPVARRVGALLLAVRAAVERCDIEVRERYRVAVRVGDRAAEIRQLVACTQRDLVVALAVLAPEQLRRRRRRLPRPCAELDVAIVRRRPSERSVGPDAATRTEAANVVSDLECAIVCRRATDADHLAAHDAAGCERQRRR